MKRAISVLVLCVVPLLVHAASQEVFLLPKKPGRPSEIVHPDKMIPGVEYLIQYDGGESNYYLSGLYAGDTLGVFFEPPVGCTLLEVHFCKYAYTDPPEVDHYYALVADVPDGVTLDDFDEYHSSASMPGPSPVGTIFEGPTQFPFAYTGDWVWDTLVVASQPDIGTNAFYAGGSIEDSTSHSVRIDAGVSPPYYAVGYKQGGDGPATNGPGWYSSWHLFWVRALVKVYENLPPEMTYDLLSDSYETGDRTVTAHVWDLLGIPADSHGVAWVNLYYSMNSSPEDTIPMMLVSGDSTDGMYSADIPGVAVGDTVTYHVAAEDYNGVGASSSPATYVIRAGTPGNLLVLIEDDDYYGTAYNHDPLGSVTGNVDYWDEYEYGLADSSVLNFYHPSGKGSGVIFWFGFSGFHFADETDFLADFLDAGGKLFVSSQDLAGGGFALGYGSWNVGAGHFLYDYMKVSDGLDDYLTDSTFTQYGLFGDPIGGAANLAEITVYPEWYDNYAGRFDMYADTCVSIFYDALGAEMGYRYQDASGYQVVWIYWPIQEIHTQDLLAYDTAAQDTLVKRTLEWFGFPIVGIEDEESRDVEFRCSLHYCNPNPASNRTAIEYSLSSARDVSLSVYDITGRLVKTLVDGRVGAGDHSVEWNLQDDSNGDVAAGVYFYRLETSDFHATKKLIVVR